MPERILKSLRGKPAIWIIVILLCFISIVEVFSATSRMTFSSGNYWSPVIRHGILLCAGVFGIYLIHLIRYKYYSLGILLLPLSIVLLAYLMIKGHRGNSVERWIDLGFFDLQPSELAKLGLIITTAWLLSKMDVTDRYSQSHTFTWLLVITAITCGLILPFNLSTSVLLAVVVFMMMWVGRIRRKYMLALGGGVALAAFAFFLILVTVPRETLSKGPIPRMATWQARIQDFMGGDGNPSAIEYARTELRDKPQETHANIAIATSNIIGKMPGNSTERDFLQEASSDFIYAIIIEELGALGGIAVMLIYIWFLIKAGGVASACGEARFPRYIVMGVSLQILMQALVNMAVAVGAIPVTGQPLPLISTGGTSILVTCAYFGMILGISWQVEQPADAVAKASADAVAKASADIPQELETQTTENQDIQE